MTAFDNFFTKHYSGVKAAFVIYVISRHISLLTLLLLLMLLFIILLLYLLLQLRYYYHYYYDILNHMHIMNNFNLWLDY